MRWTHLRYRVVCYITSSTLGCGQVRCFKGIEKGPHPLTPVELQKSAHLVSQSKPHKVCKKYSYGCSCGGKIFEVCSMNGTASRGIVSMLGSAQLYSTTTSTCLTLSQPSMFLFHMHSLSLPSSCGRVRSFSSTALCQLTTTASADAYPPGFAISAKPALSSSSTVEYSTASLYVCWLRRFS